MSWKISENLSINLLSPKELHSLPDDTQIVSITGEIRFVKDPDYDYPPDDAERYGFTGWGLPVIEVPAPKMPKL